MRWNACQAVHTTAGSYERAIKIRGLSSADLMKMAKER